MTGRYILRRRFLEAAGAVGVIGLAGCSGSGGSGGSSGERGTPEETATESPGDSTEQPDGTPTDTNTDMNYVEAALSKDPLSDSANHVVWDMTKHGLNYPTVTRNYWGVDLNQIRSEVGEEKIRGHNLLEGNTAFKSVDKMIGIDYEEAGAFIGGLAIPASVGLNLPYEEIKKRAEEKLEQIEYEGEKYVWAQDGDPGKLIALEDGSNTVRLAKDTETGRELLKIAEGYEEKESTSMMNQNPQIANDWNNKPVVSARMPAGKVEILETDESVKYDLMTRSGGWNQDEGMFTATERLYRDGEMVQENNGVQDFWINELN